MTKSLASLRSFLGNESGATAVEYALLLGLMTIALVGALSALGASNADQFKAVSDGFPQ